MKQYDYVLLYFRSTRVEFENGIVNIIDNSEIRIQNDIEISSADGKCEATVYGTEISSASELTMSHHPKYAGKTVFIIHVKENLE